MLRLPHLGHSVTGAVDTIMATRRVGGNGTEMPMDHFPVPLMFSRMLKIPQLVEAENLGKIRCPVQDLCGFRVPASRRV